MYAALFIIKYIDHIVVLRFIPSDFHRNIFPNKGYDKWMND